MLRGPHRTPVGVRLRLLQLEFVHVDVDMKSEHFETCCRYLRKALMPFLYVPQEEIRIISLLPDRCAKMVMMMPVAAILLYVLL